MQGYRTWIGIVIAVLGLFGWGDLVNEEQLSELVNLISQVIGLIVIILGNYFSHREIKAKGGYRK